MDRTRRVADACAVDGPGHREEGGRRDWSREDTFLGTACDEEAVDTNPVEADNREEEACGEDKRSLQQQPRLLQHQGEQAEEES